MATNLYFRQNVKSEQNLVEDIIIESLKMYGQDVYYLPRDIVNKDPIFADDIPSRFNSSYRIEMYIDNPDGYDGEGNLFTKFGIELRDQVTMTVSRRRWRQTVQRHDNEISGDRPREGDLLYIPMTKAMFEITEVKHEMPFYQLSNLPTYKLICQKFEYSDEQLNTGIEEIDAVETQGYRQVLQLGDSASRGFLIGQTLTQLLPSGATVSGEIVYWNDSDNILEVAHVGSDDDRFHLFVDGVNVTSYDSDNVQIIRLVTATDERLNQRGAQNNEFDNVDFIVFDENNPFGDPEVL